MGGQGQSGFKRRKEYPEQSPEKQDLCHRREDAKEWNTTHYDSFSLHLE